MHKIIIFTLLIHLHVSVPQGNFQVLCTHISIIHCVICLFAQLLGKQWVADADNSKVLYMECIVFILRLLTLSPFLIKEEFKKWEGASAESRLELFWIECKAMHKQCWIYCHWILRKKCRIKKGPVFYQHFTEEIWDTEIKWPAQDCTASKWQGWDSKSDSLAPGPHPGPRALVR